MTFKAFLQNIVMAVLFTSLYACSSSDGTGNVTDVTARDPAPTIIVTGENPVVIAQWEAYEDLGATALNNMEEAVEVIVTGTVDTSKAGIYTLTYTATDADGNTTTTTRTVNVMDETPPVITLAGDDVMSVELGSSYSELGAAAKDDDLDIEVTIEGTVNPSLVGVYTVSYTAIDEAENSSSISRTVNVVDTTAPVITINGDASVEVLQNTSYSEQGASATDVSGDVAVVITGAVDTSKVDTYVVTYTATDSSDNTSRVTRSVNVVDKTPPSIILNGASAVDVERGLVYSELGASAEDNGAAVDVVVSGNVDSSTIGAYTVTYTATDSSGNTATSTRTVKVVDTTPPLITLSGDSSVDVELGGLYSELGASAKDGDVDLDVTIAGEVDTAVLGSYTITYSATDSANNTTTTVTRTVNVVDTTPPTISLNGDSNVTVPLNTPYTELGATTTDNDIDIALITSGAVDESVSGEYKITYTATDNSGNTSLVTRTVTVLSGEVSKTFTYDIFGRVINEDFGDGRSITYTYDDSGNLINQTVVGGEK